MHRRRGDGIVSNASSHVEPGSIVLMHDGGGNREQTVAALDQILRSLDTAGYRFATLPC
jgi:peptidoglycan/xylan/chitin deacetylase (PgdA/CDA1 family)